MVINQMLNGLAKMTDTAKEISPDLLLLEFTIVNACIVGEPNSGEWVLVDTALPTSAAFIRENAEKRFGKDSRPEAIVLTHGHFDHVGSVAELAEKWDLPVYAHELEIPYITGQKDYPQGDPTVDEGWVAKMSPAFPHKSINLGQRAVPLPRDGSVPGMPGWRWIHTPGHTEGHVSFFRDSDRMLIAGDAFTTTKQESLMAVVTQREEIKGPPAYLTTDWAAAEQSVKRLEDLKPSMVLPGHGQPMKGDELARHLEMLAKHFDEMAVPAHGRFVE